MQLQYRLPPFCEKRGCFIDADKSRASKVEVPVMMLTTYCRAISVFLVQISRGASIVQININFRASSGLGALAEQICKTVLYVTSTRRYIIGSRRPQPRKQKGCTDGPRNQECPCSGSGQSLRSRSGLVRSRWPISKECTNTKSTFVMRQTFNGSLDRRCCRRSPIESGRDGMWMSAFR